MRQLKFKIRPAQYTFGGSAQTSSPKRARPLDTKSAMHLVLKSHVGFLRLPATVKIVNLQTEKLCRKYGFTLYRYSNNGNHLHILIRVTNRQRWRAFIRELTGVLAFFIKIITGHVGDFWVGRPFTRIIKGWGKNYRRAKDYIDLNKIEAEGGLTRSQARILQHLRRRFAEP